MDGQLCVHFNGEGCIFCSSVNGRGVCQSSPAPALEGHLEEQ